MSKKAGIYFFTLFLAVSNLLLSSVMSEVGQAQEIDGQLAVDKSIQFLQLQMAEHLKMRRLASTAPNLIGKWQGEAPNLSATGDCNVDTVLVTIAKQCGNLMNGSIKVDNDTAIPVVGGDIILMVVLC